MVSGRWYVLIVGSNNISEPLNIYIYFNLSLTHSLSLAFSLSLFLSFSYTFSNFFAGLLPIRSMAPEAAMAKLQGVLYEYTQCFYGHFAINRWLGSNLEVVGSLGKIGHVFEGAKVLRNQGVLIISFHFSSHFNSPALLISCVNGRTAEHLFPQPTRCGVRRSACHLVACCGLQFQLVGAAHCRS